MFDRLLSLFSLEYDSDYDEFYDGLSWKTFRVDSSIYDRCYHRDLLDYVRQLQFCYEQLLDEVSDSYLYDTDNLLEQFRQAHKDICTLERDKASLLGKVQGLEEQLRLARQWQSVKGRQAEIDNSLGREVEEPGAKVSKMSNRFMSKNGATRIDNMMLAAAYSETGWSLDDIADELQLSKASVKSYVSTMHKHYTIEQRKDAKYMVFDKEYGCKEWNLFLYAKTSEKFPDKVVNLR